MVVGYKDDDFISKQTFGFWAKTIDEQKIHNKVLKLDGLSFKKYSEFNKKINY